MGQIVSIILIVFMAVVCFVLLIGGIATAVLPQDAFTVDFATDADILIGSIVSSVEEAIFNSMMNRSLDLSFSLNPSGMNSGLEVSFSFAPILIALIVLFLTMVFRYGAQLQKEADETL